MCLPQASPGEAARGTATSAVRSRRVRSPPALERTTRWQRKRGRKLIETGEYKG